MPPLPLKEQLRRGRRR